MLRLLHKLDREHAKRFGDDAYSFGEILVELGSATLCGMVGITNEHRPDHAQYVSPWPNVLKSDNRAIFSIAVKIGEKRSLRVIEADDFLPLPPEHVRAILVVFAEGYFGAQSELATKPQTNSKERECPHLDMYDFLNPLGKF